MPVDPPISGTTRQREPSGAPTNGTTDSAAPAMSQRAARRSTAGAPATFRATPRRRRRPVPPRRAAAASVTRMSSHRSAPPPRSGRRRERASAPAARAGIPVARAAGRCIRRHGRHRDRAAGTRRRRRRAGARSATGHGRAPRRVPARRGLRRPAGRGRPPARPRRRRTPGRTRRSPGCDPVPNPSRASECARRAPGCRARRRRRCRVAFQKRLAWMPDITKTISASAPTGPGRRGSRSARRRARAAGTRRCPDAVADRLQTPQGVVGGDERRAERTEERHAEVRIEEPRKRTRVLRVWACSGTRRRASTVATAPVRVGQAALQRRELHEVVRHERGERQLGETEQRGEQSATSSGRTGGQRSSRSPLMLIPNAARRSDRGATPCAPDRSRRTRRRSPRTAAHRRSRQVRA